MNQSTYICSFRIMAFLLSQQHQGNHQKCKQIQPHQMYSFLGLSAYCPLLDRLVSVRFELDMLPFSSLFLAAFLKWVTMCSLQVSIPIGTYDNVPLAISLVAKHGSDAFLLNLVEILYDTLQETIKNKE